MTFTGHQVLQPVGDLKLKIHVTCPRCGGHFVSAPVAEEKVRRVLHGERVQDVFPGWTPADRELFLMTGICEACWPKDEEEDGE